MSEQILRRSAEQQFQQELDALIAAETYPVPEGWRMSPRSVLTYIMGGKAGDQVITPKYMGDRRIVEICIATLVTDRALLLIGEPGTAKSWLSEHLTAAINGNSTRVIQGTAGTTEEQIRYSWNYAMLLAKGPSFDSLVKSPVYQAMETGTIARIEEISRCASEVQDALISILSEKRISIPELSQEVAAKKGFSVIATANTRDIQTEVEIVTTRVAQMADSFQLHAALPSQSAVERVVTIFRELRQGQTMDGKYKLKPTSGVLSSAEAISLLINSMALAGRFGSGSVTEEDLASALQGAIVKDEAKDQAAWTEYLENVMRKRGADYAALYAACREQNG